MSEFLMISDCTVLQYGLILFSFQMLEEKHRFRKAPYNYAMRKTQLMKERDMALAR